MTRRSHQLVRKRLSFLFPLHRDLGVGFARKAVRAHRPAFFFHSAWACFGEAEVSTMTQRSLPCGKLEIWLTQWMFPSSEGPAWVSSLCASVVRAAVAVSEMRLIPLIFA
jgi:hypothetical protein